MDRVSTLVQTTLAESIRLEPNLTMLCKSWITVHLQVTINDLWLCSGTLLAVPGQEAALSSIRWTRVVHKSSGMLSTM